MVLHVYNDKERGDFSVLVTPKRAVNRIYRDLCSTTSSKLSLLSSQCKHENKGTLQNRTCSSKIYDNLIKERV